MFTRESFDKNVWVAVPDRSNPPAGAQRVTADHLNRIEDGVEANRNSLHSACYPLVVDEFTEVEPFDAFHEAALCVGPVTADNWSYAGLLEQTRGGEYALQKLSSSDGIFQRRALAGSKDGWLSQTSYPVDSVVQPNMGADGYYYKATTGGTSGSQEPSWGSGNVSDGSVVWQREGTFWEAWA